MSKKVLLITLCGLLLLGVTGCENVEKNADSSKNEGNSQEHEMIDNDSQSSLDDLNNDDSSNDYYVGTYYLVLTDGTLAKDGSGTIILNADGTCEYYYGWSNFGCISYTVNDHLITLKTTENSSDIYLTLDVDNKILIDANNEKYLKEE